MKQFDFINDGLQLEK